MHLPKPSTTSPNTRPNGPRPPRPTSLTSSSPSCVVSKVTAHRTPIRIKVKTRKAAGIASSKPTPYSQALELRRSGGISSRLGQYGPGDNDDGDDLQRVGTNATYLKPLTGPADEDSAIYTRRRYARLAKIRAGGKVYARARRRAGYALVVGYGAGYESQLSSCHLAFYALKTIP